MPVSSQEIMCMEDCLEVKELAIEKDGESGASLLLCSKPDEGPHDRGRWGSLASLLLSKKPVSSQEACKEHFLGVKELMIEEDGEVWASFLLNNKPVSSQANTC
eukprot:6085394-Ditylum_brightwellii.AAC.1